MDTHNHSDLVNALKYYVILQVFGIASSCMGRVAFIFYLLPILSTTKISKIILRGLLTLQVVNFVSIVLLLSQCRDIRGIWDPLFAERTECMDVSVEIYYGYFQCCKLFIKNPSRFLQETQKSSLQRLNRFDPLRLPVLYLLESQTTTPG